MAEFLPLCDVLFNVISLAGYFCDVVFDIVMGYALLERGYKGSFAAAISIVITSLLISQVVSLRWYLGARAWCAEGGERGRGARPPWLPLALHALQLGVLWRYARLLVPVHLSRVKHQVRDLCMLRLVHAFCEAAPMLLLQLHILFRDAQPRDLDPAQDPSVDEPAANKAFAELNVISASLSLFSVCWALASFSKNVRLHNVHRLVLTWLGLIFQFLWRLGTVSARMCALTVYALVYEYWVFLVIGLHWLSMFLWLVSPRNAFPGERMPRARKAALSALVAAVHVLAYVNLHDRHRRNMVTFYCVMCVENWVLVLAWWWGGGGGAPVAAAHAAAFAAGLAFMLLYYRYFHVRRLGYMLSDQKQGTNSTNASSQNKNGKLPHTDNAAIPGVFNCRFSNPVNNSAANGRKKKKPTSFVPPPAAPAPTAAFWRRPLPTATASAHNHHGGSSENEGSSVGSRVNIQQKLQEKKQKQLAELRVIEEEIKQGKLASTVPGAADEIYSSLQRQPIPRAKTHAEPPVWASDTPHSYQNYPLPHNLYPTYTEIKPDFYETKEDLKPRRLPTRYDDPRTFYENPSDRLRPNYSLDTGNYSCGVRNVLNGTPSYIPDVASDYKQQTYGESQGYLGYSESQYGCKESWCGGAGAGRRRRQRCRTPEVLLAPQYLQACTRQVCCHWGTYTNRPKEGSVGASSGSGRASPARAHSDIDSQMSLPRSYTLPREFRYWRRRRAPAPLPSNNSSDGDVDSADNESDARSQWSGSPPRRAAPRHKAETKL